MFGTIVNFAAIIAGGLVGLLLKKGIDAKYETALHQAMGMAVMVIGINGVISNMFTVDASAGTLSSSGELLLVISLCIGVLIGEKLGIEEHLNGLSGLVEEKFHLTGFAASFVNGTLIYCVGAMAIIGSINDGLRGDSSVLLVKSTLDGISSIVLGATMGPGVIFSAIPVLVYQGAISLLAGVLAPVLQGELLNQICAVGFVMVACIGVNFFDRLHIKVANFLPALLVPPLWAGIRGLLALAGL
ncbi:MAG: DUF554 domain-containing protein [Oscillospiraceae bacterium]|nr:DUF554 domain-containing protein [Oscillospiraceae bacterium]